MRRDDSATRVRRNKKKKKGKKGNQEEFPEDVYKEDETLQPSMINTVKLEGGVNLYEGEKERRGPPVDPDPMHMARAEYMLLSAPPPENVPTAEPTANIADLEAEAEALAAAAAAAAALADIEADEAAAKAAAAAAAALLAAEEERKPKPPSEPKPDYNQLMTLADDWGKNPVGAREYRPENPPKKPNQKQRQLTAKMTGGEQVKNPRDRPFINASPHKKKLPAPPLGKTTGHGHPVPLSGSSMGFNSMGGVGSKDGTYSTMPTLVSPIAQLSSATPTLAKKSFKTFKQQKQGGQVARTEHFIQLGVKTA